jgi:streptomycin 6-kinase
MTSEKLNHYLQLWQLSNAQPLAQTNTSDVYTVDYNGEKAALKILNETGIHDESGGAVALHCFNGQGAVKLLRHDTGAHLLEFVGGTDLVAMVREGHDEQAAAIIGDVLNQLHSAYTGIEPDGLWTLKRRFKALFDKAQVDKQAGEQSIFVRAAKLAEDLLAHPQHETVLHGDMHHENIRYHEQRGWLAFDPKGVYGEKTYDAANVLCNPFAEVANSEDRLLRISKILADKMQLEHSRVLQFVFAHACLSVCWSIEDEDEDTSWWMPTLSIAEKAERHIPSSIP